MFSEQDILHLISDIRPYLGGFFCILGGALAVIGAIGLLRFPDFYTRLHAAGVTDTGAVFAILFGLVLLSPDWLIVIKLVAIGIFICLTGPTASHAIANAAHTAGLQPFIGKFGVDDESEGEG